MKYPSIPFFAAALLASVAGTPAASASTLYDGGSPDQGGSIFAESPNAVAVSFMLVSDSTVTDAHWWGGCFPAVACTGGSNFQISIWSDISGTIGNVLASRQVGGANETATGNLIGPAGSFQWNEYEYNTTFTSIPLSAGTYWFSITETQAENTGFWGAETTSSAPSGQQLLWFNDGQWISLPEQIGFQLTGSVAAVPGPIVGAGLPGLLAGFGAMLAWYRKRRAVVG